MAEEFGFKICGPNEDNRYGYAFDQASLETLSAGDGVEHPDYGLCTVSIDPNSPSFKKALQCDGFPMQLPIVARDNPCPPVSRRAALVEQFKQQVYSLQGYLFDHLAVYAPSTANLKPLIGEIAFLNSNQKFTWDDNQYIIGIDHIEQQTPEQLRQEIVKFFVQIAYDSFFYLQQEHDFTQVKADLNDQFAFISSIQFYDWRLLLLETLVLSSYSQDMINQVLAELGLDQGVPNFDQEKQMYNKICERFIEHLVPQIEKKTLLSSPSVWGLYHDLLNLFGSDHTTYERLYYQAAKKAEPQWIKEFEAKWNPLTPDERDKKRIEYYLTSLGEEHPMANYKKQAELGWLRHHFYGLENKSELTKKLNQTRTRHQWYPLVQEFYNELHPSWSNLSSPSSYLLFTQMAYQKTKIYGHRIENQEFSARQEMSKQMSDILSAQNQLSRKNRHLLTMALLYPNLDREDHEILVHWLGVPADQKSATQGIFLGYFVARVDEIHTIGPARLRQLAIAYRIEGLATFSQLAKLVVDNKSLSDEQKDNMDLGPINPEMVQIEDSRLRFKNQLFDNKHHYIDAMKQAEQAYRLGDLDQYQQLWQQASEIAGQTQQLIDNAKKTQKTWQDFARQNFAQYLYKDSDVHPKTETDQPYAIESLFKIAAAMLDGPSESFETRARQVVVDPNQTSFYGQSKSLTWNFHGRIKQVATLLKPDTARIIQQEASNAGIDPVLVAAIILAEQRDQTFEEDTADFWAGIIGKNTSIGLGQIRVQTARRLFKEELAEAADWEIARKLEEPRFNIKATIKVIQEIQTEGQNYLQRQPNILEIGSRYTSSSFTRAQAGWGWYVQIAYADAQMSGLFGEELIADGLNRALQTYDNETDLTMPYYPAVSP